MRSQYIMQYVLIGIMLVCGYVYLFQIAAKRTTNKAALPLISILLLVIYAIIMIPLMIIINSIGDFSTILLVLLLLISCIVIFAGVYSLIRERRSVRWGMVAAFVVYAVFVGYITVFSRDGTSNDTSILLSFSSIKEALDTHSFEPLNHMLLNIVMFIPLGFLLVSINPQKLNRPILVAIVGLMISTVIESTQLFLRIGQCDVEDLVGNMLGAFLGAIAYRVYLRFRPEEA